MRLSSLPGIIVVLPCHRQSGRPNDHATRGGACARPVVCCSTDTFASRSWPTEGGRFLSAIRVRLASSKVVSCGILSSSLIFSWRRVTPQEGNVSHVSKTPGAAPNHFPGNAGCSRIRIGSRPGFTSSSSPSNQYFSSNCFLSSCGAKRPPCTPGLARHMTCLEPLRAVRLICTGPRPGGR